jgi:hypothetical protein
MASGDGRAAGCLRVHPETLNEIVSASQLAQRQFQHALAFKVREGVFGAKMKA